MQYYQTSTMPGAPGNMMHFAPAASFNNVQQPYVAAPNPPVIAYGGGGYMSCGNMAGVQNAGVVR